MTEPRDLEASLSEMHRKLHELQQELARLTQGSDRAPEPAAEPPRSPEAEALEVATARVTELGRRIDELVELRKELENATQALQEEHARAASRQTAR
jgi:prefoldin subunit 5